MGKYYLGMAVGVLGLAVMVAGCAKAVKPDTAIGEAVEEERVTSSSEIGEPVPDTGKEDMKETEVGRTEAGKDESKSGGGLQTIFFDFDKFNIREDMRSIMKSNAEWLTSHPDLKVSIEGHADERGTNEYNLALGERRAKAANRYLISLGVSKNRLSTISYGEERSSCSEKNENCYSENRRAQFKLR